MFTDDPDLTRYKYPPDVDLAAQLIVPRAPGRRPLSHNEDEDDDDDEDKSRKKKKPIKIPKDLEEEISHFQIPIPPAKRHVRKRKVKKSAKPKRSAKKNKSKGKPKDEYDIMVEDIDADDHHEEEEETEEKKEKIHKLTIKKKRPRKNVTEESSTVQPYRTIIETAQSGAPHRFQRPYTRITRQRLRPLVVKDVDVLDPAGQPLEENLTKAVKPRDVSLILRTKNRHPRILIRRYKPYINALTYPFLGQHPPAQPPVRKKKRRKHRKRRKKIKRPYGHHQASSCSNEHPLTQPIDTFEPHSDHYVYPFPSGDYSYEPSKFSSLDVAVPTNDYASAPYDSYVFPSESPFSATIPLENLEHSDLPATYEENTDGLSADEPMSIGYDVHEHENTAELAANHKQETDDSIDEENEPLQYDDGETEEGNRGNNGDVDYENEAEESLRFVSMFGKTTRASKPIKKSDSAVQRSRKQVKSSW